MMISANNSLKGKITAEQNLSAKLNNKEIYIYPELEEITVVPALEGQELEPSKYGYSKITVKAIPATDVTVVPTEEHQNLKGIFKEVNINPIQTEEIITDLDFSSGDAIELKAQEGVYIKKATIKKDANLSPENIKSGVTVCGVSGELNIGDTREKILMPTGLSINGNILTWNLVENAIGYMIYDGNIFLGSTYNSSYDLNSLDLSVEHTIFIKAISGHEDYANSDKISIPLIVLTYDGKQDTDNNALMPNGGTLNGVANINQLNLLVGYGVSGVPLDDMDWGPNYTKITGRSTSITNALYGNFDGKTVHLANPRLSDGTIIYYTLSYLYVVDGKYKGSQYMSLDKKLLSGEWFSEDTVLPIDESNTNPRILIIAFKNGNGSTNFTASQINELKDALVILD